MLGGVLSRDRRRAGVRADALERLRRKKNLRIMRYRAGHARTIAAELRVRSALGGVLAEDDDPQAPPERWKRFASRPDRERVARP
jgi:AICAR transformylase/IMP cyclohydrolase PurH